MVLRYQLKNGGELTPHDPATPQSLHVPYPVDGIGPPFTVLQSKFKSLSGRWSPGALDCARRPHGAAVPALPQVFGGPAGSWVRRRHRRAKPPLYRGGKSPFRILPKAALKCGVTAQDERICGRLVPVNNSHLQIHMRTAQHAIHRLAFRFRRFRKNGWPPGEK